MERGSLVNWNFVFACCKIHKLRLLTPLVRLIYLLRRDIHTPSPKSDVCFLIN